jgi:uncharacterized protein with HEPN domain
MSAHDDDVSLRHMLDHAREAVSMARTRTRADLDTDRMLNLALTHLLEIVGEAASRVSLNTRKRHEVIPWTDIVALRNRIIHGYDSVDFDVVWRIMQAELPPLITVLEGIIAEHGR